MLAKDLIGKRYGRLVVIGTVNYGLRGPVLWKLECDCGVVIAMTTNGLSGATNSCGCLRKEIISDLRRKYPKVSYKSRAWDECDGELEDLQTALRKVLEQNGKQLLGLAYERQLNDIPMLSEEEK